MIVNSQGKQGWEEQSCLGAQDRGWLEQRGNGSEDGWMAKGMIIYEHKGLDDVGL